jgi:multidrug efflux system membrane fusion protein
MKRWIKWVIAVVVFAAIGMSVMRALQARKVQQETVAAATAANAKAQSVVELTAIDVVTAQIRELSIGLPISGSLKAANSAYIKARVAGELQGLTVREGDSVKAGQVIARIDVTEYAARQQQAQDQADAAKAQIAIAQRQFDNNKALVDQGFISKTALDTSLATLNSAQATHRAALSNVDIAKKTMSDTVLRSPISGIVSQRLAQPGERVGIDARVLEVIDTSRMELEANITATDAMNVAVGQTAILTIEGSAAPVKSQVLRINPNTQAGSRNVLVYFSISDPADRSLNLRQGLFAQGIVGTTKISTLTVPFNSVRNDKPVPYVQVLDGGVVKHVSVELAQRGEVITAGRREAVVAITGIPENTQVLVGSLGILREGTTTKFIQAAAK